MAYATHTNQSAQGVFGLGWLAGLRTEIAERLAQRQLYSRTRRELAMLSDRELADLGIHRADIHALALDAARGGR